MASVIRQTVSSEEKSLNRQVSEQQRNESAAREKEKQKQLDQAAQKKPQFVAEWKNKLIDDLNRRHFAGTIVDVGGAQYTGIASATPDKLTMTLPYGSTVIDWARL